MNDLSFDDPCLVFALRREWQSFRREFRPHQRFPGAPCWARFCGPAWLTVLVLETGVGSGRTGAALEWLAEPPSLGNLPYRPKVVLSAGFSGGLQGDRAVGDVILATEVIDLEGNSWPATWPGELPPGEWRPPLHRGRVLSVPQLVADPAEKRALGVKHAAVAVDMESAAVARSCGKCGVPFGCVRVILDDVHTPLSPRLFSLLRGSGASPLRLLAGLARSPRLAGELWRLAAQSGRAAEQLGKALGELLTLTLPWTSDL